MLPSIAVQKVSKKIGHIDLKFQPFNVGLENLLLIVKDSKDPKEILEAILQIEDECLLDDWRGKAKALPSYIAEMLFIELRKVSNGTEIPINLNCKNIIKDSSGKEKTCGTQVQSIIDLNSVKIITPEDFKDTFVIEGESKIYVKLGVLSAGEIVEDLDQISSSTGIYKHLKSITTGDEIITKDDVSKDDLLDWINKIPLSVKADMTKHFFGKMPHIHLGIPFKCTNENCNHEHNLEFTSVLDFFI
ncbi:baseplate hub subunit [Acinetobacter phage SH-Ab 15599]|nr:baseplate hub subunit [Acinetobacter phage SH-Ab 15599]